MGYGSGITVKDLLLVSSCKLYLKSINGGIIRVYRDVWMYSEPG
jgi:hypothetical protein